MWASVAAEHIRRLPALTAHRLVLHAARMHCHACDAEYEIAPGERIGFRDDCERCGADLHSCLNCKHYDASAYNECHESSADRVLDKARANRCEWFRPGARVGGDGSRKASALSDLENLFKK